MTEDEWTIYFYVEESMRKPVQDFLKSLDEKTQVRFLASIEQLRVRNLRAREPLVRHVEGKIWELREESDTNIYRILYFFFTGRRIVLLHGFTKKTQKLPRRELEVARKRLVDFLKQKGK